MSTSSAKLPREYEAEIANRRRRLDQLDYAIGQFAARSIAVVVSSAGRSVATAEESYPAIQFTEAIQL
jgi:hypothetical protein